MKNYESRECNPYRLSWRSDGRRPGGRPPQQSRHESYRPTQRDARCPQQLPINMPTTCPQAPSIATINPCAGLPRMLGLCAGTDTQTALVPLLGVCRPTCTHEKTRTGQSGRIASICICGVWWIYCAAFALRAKISCRVGGVGQGIDQARPELVGAL